ncbi:MAG: hypothetical protein ACK5BG_14585 [Pseudanabaena sp.]
MPKGVEHDIPAIANVDASSGVESLMPKGVEHRLNIICDVSLRNVSNL